MKKITFANAAEFNAYASAHRSKIINVNGLDCQKNYPIFDTTSNKHVTYYSVDKQCSVFIEGPYNVIIAEIINLYKVTYSGNASRFKNLESEIYARSERAAIETIYQQIMPENYFQQEDGSILDCDGHEVATANDIMIEYDGGYFSAEKIQ